MSDEKIIKFSRTMLNLKFVVKDLFTNNSISSFQALNEVLYQFDCWSWLKLNADKTQFFLHWNHSRTS